MLNERGKWESWVIIRKALFSAYRCLLFILHRGWGQNALIGELNKLRKQVCSLSRAGLRLKMCFRFFWRALLVILILLFLFCSRSGKGLFSVLMQTVSSLLVFFFNFLHLHLYYFQYLVLLLTLHLSHISSGRPAVRWRQPEKSFGEGEVGSVSHAPLYPSRLSEPSPWHDWSGCLQKTNGQFS